MKEETIRRLKEKNELSKEACRQAMDFAAGQVKENLKEFTHSFKKAYSEEGFYRPTPNVNWTTGFWTGQRGSRMWITMTWASSTALPASQDIS